MVSSKSFSFAFQIMALSLILTGLYGSGRSSLACIEEERVGLMNLKSAFNFPDGSALPSWRNDRTSDCCGWEGVTCSNTSMRVTELLVGLTRPDSLGSWSLNASLFLPFQELELLDLSDNALTAFMDTPSLKRLRVLQLSGNKLTQVPSLGTLPSLKEVYLGGNPLKNISHLEGFKLEVLDVSNINLATEDLSTIWNITSLKVLSIGGIIQLNISIFPGLCQLLNLELLDAYRGGIVGVISPCLQNMTSLYSLDLRDNHFGGNIPSNLFNNLWSLEYIALSSNAFEGSFSLATLTNNSVLKVFELINNLHPLSVTTENPLYAPLAQLKLFRLSHCTINEPHGVIPSFLRNQKDLELLEMNHNNMRDDFPSWLLENNTKLEVLELTDNALSGSFTLNSSFLKNLAIWRIDISSNYIDGGLPVSIGSFFPNMELMDISKNLIYGGIPSSLGDMRSLSSLDMSSNNFMGEIPELLLSRCQSLRALKLSNNNLQGQVLPRIANLTSLRSLSLDNNQFTGEISPGLLNSFELNILDVSNNLLSGAIPSWIGDFAMLKYLLLSNNSLKGPLPWSFCRLNLLILDLSSNGFGPTVQSCVNVSALRHLRLGNNHLTGSFPRFLSGASSIVTMDLSNNGLSGTIPPWISSFSNLRALLLKGNNFDGLIPHQLCQVYNISILDLSNNNLLGEIPSCLNNLSFGSLRELGAFSTVEYSASDYEMKYELKYNFIFIIDYIAGNVYSDGQLLEVKFISKSRSESYRGSILEYMSGLDLSCNNLSGSIPREIGYLIGIHMLNLSNNHLTGSIPTTFSGLSAIESLDLSYNRLSGQIPQQLIDLYRLSIFSVAHNNLSGRTPERKSQFATFDKKSYEGNSFLCGPPLESCSSSGQSAPMLPHPDQEEDHSLRDAFIWSFAGSYVLAFFGSLAFFFLNSYYSALIFNFCRRHIMFMYYK